jgi:hypothetical protein
MAVSANKLELLQIADAVAREKSIDRGIVIAAMEDAIAKAARARYGSETDVHAEIDAKKGELRLSRHMLVVDVVENSANQISLVDAQRANPGAQVGDTIADTLPPLEYGRIAAQSAKQVIVQKVREAEPPAPPPPPPRPAISGIQGPHRRYRQRHRQARRIWQRHRRSRPRRSHRAARRNAAARGVPQRRPRPRLYFRRAARDPGAPDFPLPHPSAIHGKAVRAGSAGNL